MSTKPWPSHVDPEVIHTLVQNQNARNDLVPVQTDEPSVHSDDGVADALLDGGNDVMLDLVGGGHDRSDDTVICEQEGRLSYMPGGSGLRNNQHPDLSSG